MFSKCHKQKFGGLFDHLVGGSQQLVGHDETERFGSLEIDHQFIFGWCLHRQVGWFSPFRMRST